MTRTVLHIDASARGAGSITRELSARAVEKLGAERVIYRDLAQPLPQINEAWIGANFTPEDQRDAVQRDTLALSDALVAELKQADLLVIGLPVYNFAIPASLKAWVDQVARAGVTFRYTENGPEGLLRGKRAVLVVASGGTPVGSEIDFATGYMRHMLGFMGITEVQIIAADRQAVDPDASRAAAERALEGLAAA